MRHAPPTHRAPVALLCALAALLAAPGGARADEPGDWLALLPDCAFGPEARQPGTLDILYPRPGLVAVVPQGGHLVARVKVPSALTPPPGIQRDRALVGWSAELEGDAVAATPGAEHRYEVRVADVRPDAHSTLIYRVTLPIPAWLAPGTYALRMTAPWAGPVVRRGAVRVVSPDRAPRMWAVGEPPSHDVATLRRLGATLAARDVDVWVLRRTPALVAAFARAPAGEGATPPMLWLDDDGGPPAALRLGPELLVLGRCRPSYVAFDDQVAALEGLLGLSARALGVSDLPGPGLAGLHGAAEAPGPLPPVAALEVLREGDAVRVRVPPSAGGPVALAFAVPEDGRATVVSGGEGEVAWYPATPLLGNGFAPSLLARVVAAPGAEVRVARRDAPPLPFEVEVSPAVVPVWAPVTFTARAGRPARVAWEHGEDRTAVGPSVTRTYQEIGRPEVYAMAVDAEGVAARATAGVRVETRRVGICAASPGPAPAGFLLLLGAAWTMGAVRLTMRRRARRE